jgi:hypothetical protein
MDVFLGANIEAEDVKLNDLTHLTDGGSTAGNVLSTGANFVVYSTPGSCALKYMAEYSAATGEFATLRLRARSYSAQPVVCGNFSASARKNDYGNLFAVQGYAQPGAYTQATAANVVCGLYSCIDIGGASVGKHWSTWIDTHMTVKPSGGAYMLRISHNGTVAADGAITVYAGGRLPYLFNFEDSSGFLTNSDARIQVMTPSGAKYIALT